MQQILALLASMLMLFTPLSMGTPEAATQGEAPGGTEAGTPTIEERLQAQTEEALRDAVARPVSVERGENGGLVFTLELTEAEQGRGDLMASLILLQKEEDGGYRWLFRDTALPIRFGRVYYDATALCATTEDGAPDAFIPAERTGYATKDESYTMGALYGYGFGGFCQTDWVGTAAPDTGLFRRQEVVPRGGGEFYEDAWEYVMFMSNSRMPTLDTQNRLMPYFQWDDGNLGRGTESDVSEMPVFVRLPLRDCTGIEENLELFVLIEPYAISGGPRETAYPLSGLIPLRDVL